MPHPRLNETILALYRGCRDVPAHDFKEWAMETAQRAVAFDSGIWVTSDIVSDAFNSVYLFHQPREMMENYDGTVRLSGDFLAQAVFSNPGRTINSDDVMSHHEFIRHPNYLLHCRHYGIEHGLSTCSISDITRITTCISFFRAAPDGFFSESDRTAKELLIPHMIEAMRINLFSYLHAPDRRPGDALAICDPFGVLYETTPAFPDLLSKVCPDWRGPRLNLPHATLDGADNIRWSADGIKFEASPCRDLFLVRAARETALDRLSPRQLAIADLLVQGKSYKEIARTLGISPSTVTNHVNHIHAKLGIVKREELIRLFNQER